MKYLKLTALVSLCAAAFMANPANASSNVSGKAVTACKAHVSELYSGDVSRKVKKIRTRSGEVKVNLHVTADGEKFNAVCLVDRGGELTYTTDREITEAIVSKDS
ncbi:MAG: hypothetical protein ABGY96_12105 [bacterium]|nr:hypothetical protein [Gammaproteobacteria bacterium]HIL98388.1 hypothetical protein [Pseudomonadales bacterium]